MALVFLALTGTLLFELNLDWGLIGPIALILPGCATATPAPAVQPTPVMVPSTITRS